MHRLQQQLVHLCGLPRVCCSILPPDVIARIAVEGEEAQRQAAVRTLAVSSAVRARRTLITNLRTRGVDISALAPKALNRTVFDIEHGGWNDLPGRQVRAEGDDPSDDASVNEAYDGADSTYTFYQDVYGRDSVDDAGFPLISCVHFGVDVDNAFWDGSEMVYGDGSGQIFQVGSLTTSIDVIGHELTHGGTVHRGLGVQQAVRRAQRVVLGRLRLARQAVLARTERGGCRLVDRRGDPRPRARGRPSLDERA